MEHFIVLKVDRDTDKGLKEWTQYVTLLSTPPSNDMSLYRTDRRTGRDYTTSIHNFVVFCPESVHLVDTED